jgi:hypothetical protein
VSRITEALKFYDEIKNLKELDQARIFPAAEWLANYRLLLLPYNLHQQELVPSLKYYRFIIDCNYA